MRREAWQTQRLRQELFGGGSVGGPAIRPLVDLGDMGDLGDYFQLLSR